MSKLTRREAIGTLVAAAAAVVIPTKGVTAATTVPVSVSVLGTAFQAMLGEDGWQFWFTFQYKGSREGTLTKMAEHVGDSMIEAQLSVAEAQAINTDEFRLECRRLTPQWTSIHDFYYGWGYSHKDGRTLYIREVERFLGKSVYARVINAHNKDAELDALYTSLQESENRKAWVEELKNRPPAEFKSFTMPKFNRDLVMPDIKNALMPRPLLSEPSD